VWVLIGYAIVIVAVLGGYVGAGGHIAALIQPFEFITIGGAAVGAFIVSNGLKVTKHVASEIPKLLKPSIYTKELHLQVLSLLYDLQVKARREGLITLEKDADNPRESDVFKKYPALLANAPLVEFLTDYLRLIVSGSMETTELEALMDEEIETFRESGEVPVNAITKMADSLPGFGIVAAVMGVVHTMESMDKPPEELGMLIAAALVGTFLGILLAYGFVAPLGSLMEHRLNEAIKVLQCIKVSLMTFLNGYPPAVAIEFGRKVLYSEERPTAGELEAHVKRK